MKSQCPPKKNFPGIVGNPYPFRNYSRFRPDNFDGSFTLANTKVLNTKVVNTKPAIAYHPLNMLRQRQLRQQLKRPNLLAPVCPSHKSGNGQDHFAYDQLNRMSTSCSSESEGEMTNGFYEFDDCGLLEVAAAAAAQVHLAEDVIEFDDCGLLEIDRRNLILQKKQQNNQQQKEMKLYNKEHKQVQVQIKKQHKQQQPELSEPQSPQQKISFQTQWEMQQKQNSLASCKIGQIRRSICIKNCTFEIVKRIAREQNFRIVNERDDWEIMWSDKPFTQEKLSELRRLQASCLILDRQHARLGPIVQKLNHFPGMSEICTKYRLARNLKRMQKYFPKDYDFFPETWTLPTDLRGLMYKHKGHRKSCNTFICKPDTGAQGRGIFLVRDLKSLNPFSKMICQVYIPRPFLIDGYKFDLRIYALITSIEPLRIYLFNEGIVRFATIKYEPPNDTNIDVPFMHLTNYSINKFSQSYAPDASKRKLSLIFEWMSNQGYNVEKLIQDIDGIVVKTIISAHSILKHSYKSSFPKIQFGCLCFEVLGFDILIDERMKPILLEVNHSPSLNLDLPIDEEIKGDLIRDTLSKIYLEGHLYSSQRRQFHKRRSRRPESPSLQLLKANAGGLPLNSPLQRQFDHEENHGLNYRLIYPNEQNPNLYSHFLHHANANPLI